MASGLSTTFIDRQRLPLLPLEMRGLLLALFSVALALSPAQAAAPDLFRPQSPTLTLPSDTRPGGTRPADRVAGLAAKAREYLERADRPGLRDEERDALIEPAWALCNEALDDPTLKDEALRTPVFLRTWTLLLIDDEEFEEALEVLQRLRGLAAAAPETHELVAACLMELGRAEEAIAAYRRALALGTKTPAEVRARLAYAAAVSGQKEEGLRTAEEAVVEDPAGYFGYFVRGWIHAALGRPDQAKRDYLRAVERYRDDADLWDLLGELYEREEDRTHALECYREVVRIDPSDDLAAAKVRELGAPPGGRAPEK